MSTKTIDTIQFPGSTDDYNFNAQNLVAGGTSGQVLTSNGSSSEPSWQNVSVTMTIPTSEPSTKSAGTIWFS